MRILFLSFYYRPDLCAGSFRATPLVESLSTLVPPGTEIDVLTTLPNRYQKFRKDASRTERFGNTTIHRIELPQHSSDIVGQSRAFLTYWRGCRRLVKNRSYDLVFATSSRLMTAFLGAQMAHRLKAPLYLDIRDIFVDTISDLYSGVMAIGAEAVFGRIERWTFQRAAVINLVSEGFREYFEERYPNTPLTYHTNGVDEEFLNAVGVRTAAQDRQGKLNILYAGNIGEGQCLHDIVPGLARAVADRATITVIGDGGRRSKLESVLEEQQVDNVRLIDPMARNELMQEYNDADVLFLHLGDYLAFEKVLPSKVFEYAALQKPVLAGVAGYAGKFIADEISNSAVFRPGDVNGAVQALRSLRIEQTPRPDFVQKYSRHSISQRISEDIVHLLTG